jgi:hypothetical protein
LTGVQMATSAKTTLSKTVQKAIAAQKAPTVQTNVHVRSVISIPNLWPSDAFHVSREPTASLLEWLNQLYVQLDTFATFKSLHHHELNAPQDISADPPLQEMNLFLMAC